MPSRLTIGQILAWADSYFERKGHWPSTRSGRVAEDSLRTWHSVDHALSKGFHGLPGGSSVAQLLAEYRGVRNPAALPRLTVEQVLAWADAHHRRTGQWPRLRSGCVYNEPTENWRAIDCALKRGFRGLPSNTSLAQLLVEYRGVRSLASLPKLTIRQILAWADLHHERTGRWPNRASGPVQGSSGETWSGIAEALRRRSRGLRSSSSLLRLLAKHRGVNDSRERPPLTIKQILAWADAHHARTGRWPKATSGPVVDAPGENWLSINTLLRTGGRGLPAGRSLNTLLAERREVPKKVWCPRLTIKQIRNWASEHLRRTGRLPTQKSGEIEGTFGVTWEAIDAALRRGSHGLPGGSSVSRLLRKRSKSKE